MNHAKYFKISEDKKAETKKWRKISQWDQIQAVSNTELSSLLMNGENNIILNE